MKQSFPGGFHLTQRIGLPGGIDVSQQGLTIPKSDLYVRLGRFVEPGSGTPKVDLRKHGER